jgi:hypothetical protein
MELFIIHQKEIKIMQKEKFRLKAKQTFDDIYNQIEALERKQAKVSGDAKARYGKQISNLKLQLSEMKDYYKALETSNDEKWRKAKHKFSESAKYIKSELAKLKEL